MTPSGQLSLAWDGPQVTWQWQQTLPETTKMAMTIKICIDNKIDKKNGNGNTNLPEATKMAMATRMAMAIVMTLVLK